MRFGTAWLALAITAAAGSVHADTADDPSKSWPQSDLERALVASALDKTKSADFIHALLKSEICALTAKPAKANADDKIALTILQAPDGQPAAPVFTSMQRGAEVFEGRSIVCGKAEAFLTALRGNRVVLDPGQPFGVIYTAEEIDHILGVEFKIKRSDMALQPPNDAPAAMIQKLKDTLAAEPRITRAWLSLAYWPDKKEWSWYLDVQTTLEADAVRTLIRDATRDLDMLGRPLDMTVNTSVAKPELGIELLNR